MSERILMKFIVGQRVVKQGEDSRFEGEIVACFVKRDLKTIRYVVENDDGVLHIASERQLRWPCLKLPARLEPSHCPRWASDQRLRHRLRATSLGMSKKLRATCCFKLKPKYCEAAFAAPAHANRASARLSPVSFSSARWPPGRAVSA